MHAVGGALDAIAISGGHQACSLWRPELYDREFRDYLVTGGMKWPYW